MLKDLPKSLLQSVQNVGPVLESCPSCGMVLGSCLHTEGQVQEDQVQEDNLSKEAVPGEEEPEMKLSGRKEEILINPLYLTTLTSRTAS